MGFELVLLLLIIFSAEYFHVIHWVAVVVVAVAVGFFDRFISLIWVQSRQDRFLLIQPHGIGQMISFVDIDFHLFDISPKMRAEMRR